MDLLLTANNTSTINESTCKSEYKKERKVLKKEPTSERAREKRKRGRTSEGKKEREEDRTRERKKGRQTKEGTKE